MTANETPAAKCAFCNRPPIILVNPLGTREPDYCCKCITFFQHSVPGLAMWNAAQEKLAARDKKLERVAFEAGMVKGIELAVAELMPAYQVGFIEDKDGMSKLFADWQREREGK